MKLLVFCLGSVLAFASGHHHHSGGPYKFPVYGVGHADRLQHGDGFRQVELDKLFDGRSLVFFPKGRDHLDEFKVYYVDKGFGDVHKYESFEDFVEGVDEHRDYVAYAFYPEYFKKEEFYSMTINKCVCRRGLHVGEFFAELASRQSVPAVLFWPRERFESFGVQLDEPIGEVHFENGAFIRHR